MSGFCGPGFGGPFPAAVGTFLGAGFGGPFVGGFFGPFFAAAHFHGLVKGIFRTNCHEGKHKKVVMEGLNRIFPLFS